MNFPQAQTAERYEPQTRQVPVPFRHVMASYLMRPHRAPLTGPFEGEPA